MDPDQERNAGPLAGLTVGVTAARRAEELGEMLRRRGARVLHGPAMRIIGLADDAELRTATCALVDTPPDITVITTGAGFRGWVEAAEGWGLRTALLAALGTGRLLTRGPKARGAVRGAGLIDDWSPVSESVVEVVEHLLEFGVDGRRVALQLHGDALTSERETLCRAGAEVLAVPVYRWVPPGDIAPLDLLIDAALSGDLDVLTFTSAPAVAGTLARASERQLVERLLERMRGGLLVVCVGPVTAAPLAAEQVPTVQPERSRLGSMVRRLEEAVSNRS